MAKLTKKDKLIMRLIDVEQEMKLALHQKSSGTSDILPGYMKRIEAIKQQIRECK